MKTKSLFFYILVRSWNSFEFFDTCIDSILAQKYDDYKILFIDDASDYSKKQKNHIKNKLKRHVCIFNKSRKHSVYNGYYTIHNYAKVKNSVACVVDGDDWFSRDDALDYLASVYKKRNSVLTYGDCFVWDGKNYLDVKKALNPYVNSKYSEKVEKRRDYRKALFRVGHVQTFKTSDFKKIPTYYFSDDDNWLKYSFDLAAFTTMLEQSQGDYDVMKKKLYVYNTRTKYLNIKIHPIELAREELVIRRKKKYGVK